LTGGEVIKLTAVGDTITGYLNGVQIVQATDSTSDAGDYAGFGLGEHNGFFSDGGTITVDTFSAGRTGGGTPIAESFDKADGPLGPTLTWSVGGDHPPAVVSNKASSTFDHSDVAYTGWARATTPL